MRATLYAVGALLFLAYPLIVLFTFASDLDQPREKPNTAAIVFTTGSARQLLRSDAPPRGRGELRNTTLRRSGD